MELERYKEFRRKLNKIIEKIMKEEGFNYFSSWERERRKIIKYLREIKSKIDCIASNIPIIKRRGRRDKINIRTKVGLLLFQYLFKLSNREMEIFLSLISSFFGINIDVSYKTIERIKSNSYVIEIINKLFISEIINISYSESCGDGTGFSLNISTVPYSKARDESKRKKYIYLFTILDINSNKYLSYGSGYKSEMEAFNKAIEFMEENKLNDRILTLRLDRYYTNKKAVRKLYSKLNNLLLIYLIPKKNTKYRSKYKKWNEIWKQYKNDEIFYLFNYFKRKIIESNFSSDKRRFGRIIREKRFDRIETHLLCIVTLHNLLSFKVNIYSRFKVKILNLL